MDQATLVSLEERAAGAEFLNLLNDKMPITVAFWMKLPDEENWYLYVAGANITEKDMRYGYGIISRQLIDFNSLYLDHSRVKLLISNDPFVKAIQELHQRYPGTGVLNYNGRYLAQRRIDGAIIYPTNKFPIELK